METGYMEIKDFVLDTLLDLFIGIALTVLIAVIFELLAKYSNGNRS